MNIYQAIWTQFQLYTYLNTTFNLAELYWMSLTLYWINPITFNPLWLLINSLLDDF